MICSSWHSVQAKKLSCEHGYVTNLHKSLPQKPWNNPLSPCGYLVIQLLTSNSTFGAKKRMCFLTWDPIRAFWKALSTRAVLCATNTSTDLNSEYNESTAFETCIAQWVNKSGKEDKFRHLAFQNEAFKLQIIGLLQSTKTTSQLPFFAANLDHHYGFMNGQSIFCFSNCCHYASAIKKDFEPNTIPNFSVWYNAFFA